MPKMVRRAFISYVSENENVARAVSEVLSQNGIETWFDKDMLKAGELWLNEIRRAILDGSYFIPLFSREWTNRPSSVAADELMIAIEAFRIRPERRGWLLPLKVNACDAPDIRLTDEVRLEDLHIVDFSKQDQTHAFAQLLAGMGVERTAMVLPDARKVGWPITLLIRRRDQYVGRVNLRYFIDGDCVADTADDLIELQDIEPGKRELFCDTAWFERATFQTRSNGQGTYFRGMSDRLEVSFSSGQAYEATVAADGLYQRTVSSPLFELGREAARLFNENKVILNQPQTWPKITFDVYRRH